jgi:hypothetical protein
MGASPPRRVLRLLFTPDLDPDRLASIESEVEAEDEGSVEGVLWLVFHRTTSLSSPHSSL